MPTVSPDAIEAADAKIYIGERGCCEPADVLKIIQALPESADPSMLCRMFAAFRMGQGRFFIVASISAASNGRRIIAPCAIANSLDDVMTFAMIYKSEIWNGVYEGVETTALVIQTKFPATAAVIAGSFKMGPA